MSSHILSVSKSALSLLNNVYSMVGATSNIKGNTATTPDVTSKTLPRLVTPDVILCDLLCENMEQKMFECTICQSQFKYRATANRHYKHKHLDIPKHKCPFTGCNYQHSRKDIVQKHFLTHGLKTATGNSAVSSPVITPSSAATTPVHLPVPEANNFVDVPSSLCQDDLDSEILTRFATNFKAIINDSLPPAPYDNLPSLNTPLMNTPTPVMKDLPADPDCFSAPTYSPSDYLNNPTSGPAVMASSLTNTCPPDPSSDDDLTIVNVLSPRAPTPIASLCSVVISSVPATTLMTSSGTLTSSSSLIVNTVTTSCVTAPICSTHIMTSTSPSPGLSSITTTTSLNHLQPLNLSQPPVALAGVKVALFDFEHVPTPGQLYQVSPDGILIKIVIHPGDVFQVGTDGYLMPVIFPIHLSNI